MKKIISIIALFAISMCCYAQFVLTPSSGLMTEDGPYTIIRDGSESENYYAAKKSIEVAIPDAEIGEAEYEKSFNVTSAFKDHRTLPGALVATDWRIDYTLLIECTDGKIMISFKELGYLEASKKGEVVCCVHPTSGSNSMMGDLLGNHYIFNSKGMVSKGCKKMKTLFEEYANNLVKNIEKNLK